MGSEPAPGLALRPVREDDRDFLRCLYASTRADELAHVTDWSTEQKAAFLTQQFAAQHHHFRAVYAEASFDLILDGGEPIGRFYVSRHEREIRLVDIALVPAARGRGVGTALLEHLLAEGERSGIPVTIHVERSNRALTLYRRLGFREIEEQGPYVLMSWWPNLT